MKPSIPEALFIEAEMSFGLKPGRKLIVLN